jgi:exonuclease SbcC
LLQQRLAECGFGDAAEFAAARRERSELERLAAELREYDARLGAAEHRLRRAQRDAEGLAAIDPEPLEAAWSALSAELSECARAHGACEERGRQLAHLAAELADVAERSGAVEARYAVVGRLAEVAGGQNRHGITFQRFVLATLLEDVLREATRRLRRMSNGRFELKRARERTDLRASGGLDLEVFDAHTATVRPVSSLSGGESFLASLALALGLSDVVQAYAGGLRLGTVFVDEGFGSLDAEALDLAFRTLVDVRGDDRLIGVISHVPELEERVEARLLVERGRRGSRARFAL